MTDDVAHCLEKIEHAARESHGTPRNLFQLGYNLGRLSELAALGRERAWDPWKAAVDPWNAQTLERLARELRCILT